MHWAPLSLTSALFLGFYDTCQKHALRDNPVLPVLLVSTGTCATVWSALLVLQRLAPSALPASLLVPELSWLGHAELLLKELTQDDAENYEPASSSLCTDLITDGGMSEKIGPDIGYFGLTTDAAPNAGDKLVCIAYKLDGSKLEAPL